MVGESVRQICLLDNMPAEVTVYAWLNKKENFTKQYTRAREIQADYHAEQILDIADNSTNDWEEKESERSGKTQLVLNAEAVQRSRLRIDARKWLMGKQNPKKYGDSVKITGDSDNPVEIVHKRKIIDDIE